MYKKVLKEAIGINTLPTEKQQKQLQLNSPQNSCRQEENEVKHLKCSGWVWEVTFSNPEFGIQQKLPFNSDGEINTFLHTEKLWEYIKRSSSER